MEPVMINEVNNKEWLARGEITNLQAAFFLSQLDINKFHVVNEYHLTKYIHPRAEKLLGVIETWRIDSKVIYAAPPLWYIDKAIKEGLFDLPKALLREVKNYLDNQFSKDRKRLLNRYKYLAEKLELQVECRQLENADEALFDHGIGLGVKSEIEPTWKSIALQYADEEALKLINMGIQKVTQRKAAEKVAIRFEKEKIFGKYACILDKEYIRRHALSGWRLKSSVAQMAQNKKKLGNA